MYYSYINLGYCKWFFSTVQSITNWFQYIKKPSWNPPDWLFGPVWTLLYILMGIALAFIWHSNHPAKNKAILLFAFQFALNLAWSFIFFNQHLIGWALAESLLMFVAIVLTIFSFYKINKTGHHYFFLTWPGLPLQVYSMLLSGYWINKKRLFLNLILLLFRFTR